MNARSPHLDPEWLRRKYLDEGLSTYEIAAIVNRDPKRIYEKLRDFGIPTRPRGHNLKERHNYQVQKMGPNPFQGRTHSPETKALLSEKASRPKPYIRGERNGMYGRTGPKNPNYKTGSSPERQRIYVSSEWKALIRRIYKRDGYKCVRCGIGKKTNRGLHAHHIKSWAEHPELRWDESNIVTLCRKCHEWVHSSQNTSGEYLG